MKKAKKVVTKKSVAKRPAMGKPETSKSSAKRAVAVNDRHRRRRHPLPEPGALALGQARVGDPVGEREATARAEHAAALGEHGGLVLDVEPRLLAHAGVEGVVAERQRGRVAAD